MHSTNRTSNNLGGGGSSNTNSAERLPQINSVPKDFNAIGGASSGNTQFKFPNATAHAFMPGGRIVDSFSEYNVKPHPTSSGGMSAPGAGMGVIHELTPLQKY